jgi:UDP-glucose-4-epimerase GalE
MSEAVLVTGGAGYIGSHACKALAAAGYLPVVLDNLSRGHRAAVRWGPLKVADLSDAAAVRALVRRHRIRAVLHFAAFTYVGESIDNPRLYFDNNVVASQAFIGALLDEGVRDIVFSSTAAVYGMPRHVPIPEDHPHAPINPYGASKASIETMLRWYGEAYGVNWVALRYFNAAGADADGLIGEVHEPETHLIPLAIQANLGLRGPLSVFGTDYDTPDGTAIRDYIHVADLADAHVRALRYLAGGGASGAFNVGTGDGYSVREVLKAVEAEAGTPVPARDAPRRLGDPARLVARADRIRDAFQWRPHASDLASIVRSAYAWHRRPAFTAEQPA